MRRWILAAAATAFATAPACSQEADADTALVGATIIDGSGGPAIEDGVILVAGERLACVGTRAECAVSSDVETVDVSGRYITPGLVDAHVHFAQTGWLDGRPDGIEARDVYPYEETIADLRADPGRWHRAYLCSGITAVLDPGGAPWTVTDPHATDTDRPDRAHVVAAGPLITHAERNRFFAYGALAEQPMFLPMGSDEEAVAGVEYLAELGAAAVKVWYLDPPEGEEAALDARLMRVGAAADEAGLPLWVHATELRNAKVALRAGADMLVHSVFDAPVDEEFIELLLANDAVYAPTLRVSRNWARALASVAVEDAVAIDDPNRCVDSALLDRINHPERLADAAPDSLTADRVFDMLVARGAQEAQAAANLRAVHAAGGRIVVATDAGNPLTLHGPSIYAEMEAMQAAGLPADEIIVMATRAGAEAMDRETEFGVLEAGRLADLIVLAGDPRETVANFRRLTHVMRAGVLREQADLQVRSAD